MYMNRSVRHRMTQSDLAQVAEGILCRNAFYRLLQRGSPPVAYQEISQLAQQHLQSLLAQRSQPWPTAIEQIAELSDGLLIETWSAILAEPQLKALGIHVQAYQVGTPNFQKAIDILLRAIVLSKRLKKRPASVSEEAYREAQNMLQLWICKNIHGFNPERGEFMKWLNFRFDRTYLFGASEIARKNPLGSPIHDYELDQIPSSAPTNFESNLLDWLQEDYIFRIPNRDRPEITFLDIALARLQNQQWQEIADDFGFNRLTTPRNFLTNWLNNLTKSLIAGQASPSLYDIRFSRFEGESWAMLATQFQVDEILLREAHQTQIKQFPSYRDVTRSDRYTIPMTPDSGVTFSGLTRILLEAGHLWKEPAQHLQVEPMQLKAFYFNSLKSLWPSTRPINRT
jgi:hypothetical protein